MSKGRKVPDSPLDDAIDLGNCCACQKAGSTVRNIMTLPVRAPVPGTGWGCFVCGLLSDGAVAVLCDACMESNAPIRDVCHGYPKANMRVARESCTKAFDHDPARHEDAL